MGSQAPGRRDVPKDGTSKALPTHGGGHSFSGNNIANHAQAHFGDNFIYNCDGGPQEQRRPVRDEKTKEAALLESLTFARMDARVQNITTAHPRTCQWLFTHPDFLSWTDNNKASRHHGFLWIKGKPGSGKSTIMKKLLAWIQKQDSNQITVSYFFNARAPDSLEKSPLGMYRSLVSQILKWSSVAKQMFSDHFSSKERNSVVSEWTEKELQEFLINLVTTDSIPQLNMFIDALDEGDGVEVREMVAFLEVLGEHANFSKKEVRMCLSSRHFPHIRIKKGISIVVEQQPKHKEDIREYVQTKLAGIEKHQMDKLGEHVCGKSHGIFLWVVLVVQQLNSLYDQGYSFSAIMMRLNSIPEKLDNLFGDILAKGSDDYENFTTLLQWVLFARRPLHVLELYIAIHFHHTPLFEDFDLIRDLDRLTKWVLNCSRGLVEVTALTEDVQFIHETVRESLIEKDRLLQIDPRLATTVQGLSHDKCKLVCLNYLKKCPILNPHTNAWSRAMRWWHQDRFPLLEYASTSMLDHAEAAAGYGVSQKQFLDELRADLNGVLGKIPFYKCDLYPRKELLYILAERNLINLVRSVLLLGSGEVNEFRNGIAMHIACAEGHEEVVSCLLENSVHVDATTAASATSRGFDQPPSRTMTLFGETPLSTAARYGHQRIVEILSRHAGNANVSMVGGDTALEQASSAGHLEIVEVPLEHGADVNVRQENDEGALIRTLKSSQPGKWRSVKQLLEYGAYTCDHLPEDRNQIAKLKLPPLRQYKRVDEWPVKPSSREYRQAPITRSKKRKIDASC